MNELPRRPIEPLPPPPGAFDAVVGRARYRRHRRTTTVLSVAVIFLAGVGGGMSLDGVSGMRDTIAGVVADGLAPSATPTNSAVVTPDVTPEARPARTSPKADAPKVAVAPRSPKKVRGVAVDTAGKAIAGLYVYAGQPGTDGFAAAAEPVTRTAADGSFSLPCPGAPVLLAPWRVNGPAHGHSAGGAWSATFVGGSTQAASAADAPCGTSGRKKVTTTVLKGSTLEGTVTVPERCTDPTKSLWIWLNGSRALTVRLGGLGSGDTYSVSGLPPGQHVLGANGERTKVTVGGGGTFTQDVTFGCDSDGPSETPEPTPTGSIPTPTPSDPPTSQPGPSTSLTPGPSSSGSAPPSSSSTGSTTGAP